MEKALTYTEAKIKLEAWCAYQERCSYEVLHKLQSLGVSDEWSVKLLSELKNNRFVDDARFAEAFVQGKFTIKRWGRIKIRQHLKQKRISNELIAKAFEVLDDEAYMLCIDRLIDKKLRELKPDLGAYQKKAKIHQFLASRGFEFDLIEDVLRERVLN